MDPTCHPEGAVFYANEDSTTRDRRRMLPQPVRVVVVCLFVCLFVCCYYLLFTIYVFILFYLF